MIFYILVKNIHISSANMISSPLTYGFPAIGGFVGAVHNLERRLDKDKIPFKFEGVLIGSRSCLPKLYRANRFSDAALIQTRNPLKKKTDPKEKKTAEEKTIVPEPIIEEGKIDLVVDLVIKAKTELENKITNYVSEIEKELHKLLMQQRIAGGSVFKISYLRIFNESGKVLNNQDNNPNLALIDRLLPSYILTDASAELPKVIEEMQNKEINGKILKENANALDAFLATSQIFHISQLDEGEWSKYSIKKGRGWIVPIPVGYQAIAPEIPAGKLKNSRNPEYNARFVESVSSIGKWIFPLSLKDNWQKHFWYFREPQEINGNVLYLYSTKNVVKVKTGKPSHF